MIKKTPIFTNKKIKLCSRTLSGQNVFDMQNKVLTKNLLADQAYRGQMNQVSRE